MFEKLYHVYDSTPPMYVGGVREGGLVVYVKKKYAPSKLYEGICDCIGGFRKFLAKAKIPNDPILEKTIKKIWEIEKENYSFPKCMDCEYTNNMKDNCYKSDFSLIETEEDFIRTKYHIMPTPLSPEDVFSAYPLDDFKKFNLEYQYGTRVHFICYIDKVYSPKLIDGKLHQIIKITNHNTKKIIKCDISKFADFDKWEKNQKIELIGLYDSEDGIITVNCIDVVDNPNKSKKDTNSIRQSPEYYHWRDKIKEVGECFICGRKNHLVAHHINSVSEYPELALDEKNGVCLCKAHHDIYHEDFSNTGDALSFAKFVSIHKSNI